MTTIHLIVKLDSDLLVDFDEYCNDHGTNRTEALIQFMKKVTGHKTKRVKLKVIKEPNAISRS